MGGFGLIPCTVWLYATMFEHRVLGCSFMDFSSKHFEYLWFWYYYGIKATMQQLEEPTGEVMESVSPTSTAQMIVISCSMWDF